MSERNPTVGGKVRQPKTRPPSGAVKMFPVVIDCPKCGGETKSTFPVGVTEAWIPCSCGALIVAKVTMRPDGHGSIETAVS